LEPTFSQWAYLPSDVPPVLAIQALVKNQPLTNKHNLHGWKIAFQVIISLEMSSFGTLFNYTSKK
jgi:hypothetical protein